MTEPLESSGGTDVAKEGSGAKLALHVFRIKFLLLRYWWIIALTMAIGLAVQGYRCSLNSSSYVSTSRMMVSGQINLNQTSAYNEETLNFYGTQVALMKSPDTVSEAMARVRAIHPEVTEDTGARVDANQEPKTSIFSLRVTSLNPEYAQLLLNSVMDTYLASKKDRKKQTTDGTVSAITSEISTLDAEIRADEQALLDFQKENNVVFIEEQSNSAAAYLVSLNNELARLSKEHDLLSLENSDHAGPAGDNFAVVNASGDSGNASNSPEATSNASVVTEQENIEKLKILRDEFSAYLKDAHPKMVALTEAISKEEKFLVLLKTKSLQERQAHQQNLELQIQNLDKQIADWNTKSLDLNQRLGAFQLLKNKIEREKTMYNQLALSVQNVNLNKTIDQADVVVLEPAGPAAVIPINYGLQLIYGAIFGFMVGALILYLINRLDDKVNSPMMIEGMLEFPIVGQIPLAIRNKKSKRVPLIVENDSRHILVESHRNIRSSIFFRSTIKIQPKSLLICSSAPGEGKSTLASNLAITFAFAGLRTLLIDADLRRGVLHELFETPVQPGLSDYLQQQASWREVVQNTQFPSLDIIPRGKTPHHAGELLLGMLVDLLLQESAGEYDMVLWDSAPLLAADDAANLCSRVEGVLFVVRVNHSSIHSVISAVDILTQRNAKIFGLVLNAVEPNQPGYYDRYRYKEYYATEAKA